MKIAYNTFIHDNEGTYFTQRIRLNKEEFENIKNSIDTEIALLYPRKETYEECDYYANWYLNPLKLNEHNICYLKNTHIRYLRNVFPDYFLPRLHNENTYILVKGTR